eukprot:9548986-Ditylum_brightwellii.AAC.1
MRAVPSIPFKNTPSSVPPNPPSLPLEKPTENITTAANTAPPAPPPNIHYKHKTTKLCTLSVHESLTFKTEIAIHPDLFGSMLNSTPTTTAKKNPANTPTSLTTTASRSGRKGSIVSNSLPPLNVGDFIEVKIWNVKTTPTKSTIVSRTTIIAPPPSSPPPPPSSQQVPSLSRNTTPLPSLTKIPPSHPHPPLPSLVGKVPPPPPFAVSLSKATPPSTPSAKSTVVNAIKKIQSQMLTNPYSSPASSTKQVINSTSSSSSVVPDTTATT